MVQPATTAMGKSPDAFRTISEVADELDLPQHVLRFWETRFPPIRPLKRGGGRRYYRPDDVELLRGIQQLLYGKGYTIKGVQRILKEDGLRAVQAIGRGEQGVRVAPPMPTDADLVDDPAGDGATVEDASVPARVAPVGHARPAERDRTRLQAALDELMECERILATLKSDG